MLLLLSLLFVNRNLLFIFHYGCAGLLIVFGAILAVRKIYDRENKLLRHVLYLDFILNNYYLKVLLLLKRYVEAWFSLAAYKNKRRIGTYLLQDQEPFLICFSH